MPEQTIYQRKGFRNRDHYLESLADDHGIEVSTVRGLAHILGEDEDFDGLVSMVQDVEGELS